MSLNSQAILPCKRLFLAPLWSQSDKTTDKILTEMTATIAQICGKETQLSCYVNYADKQLKNNLAKICKYLFYYDAALYSAHNYTYLLQMSEKQSSLQLFLSKSPLLAARNGSLEPFKLHIKNVANTKMPAFTANATNSDAASTDTGRFLNSFTSELVAEAANVWLANYLQADIILLIDVQELNKQSIFLLTEIFKQREIAKCIKGFALFNSGATLAASALNFAASAFNSVGFAQAQAKARAAVGASHTNIAASTTYAPQSDNFSLQKEEITAWRNLLENKFARPVLFVDAACCNLDSFAKFLQAQNASLKADAMEFYMHLSSKIYKRCSTLKLLERKIKIALAYDEAFCAYDAYELEIFTQLGVEWHFFSPLRDQKLPLDCDALYMRSDNLPLYRDKLCNNRNLRRQIKEHYHNQSLLVVAQDLAYLYLLDGFLDQEGTYWPMSGLISQKARLYAPKPKYKYALLTALQSNCFAVPMHPTLAICNTTVELQPSMYTLRTLVSLDYENKVQMIVDGYCDKQLFGTLSYLAPTANLAWTEHFFMNLLDLKAKKSYY